MQGNMRITILTIAAALMGFPAVAQDASRPAPFDAPVIAPAVAAPDCLGLQALSGATCLTAPVGQTDALVAAYSERLYTLSWLESDGSDHRRAFVRRRAGGGCDGLQMLALERGEQVLLVFAQTPGDACRADGASE